MYDMRLVLSVLLARLRFVEELNVTSPSKL